MMVSAGLEGRHWLLFLLRTGGLLSFVELLDIIVFHSASASKSSVEFAGLLKPDGDRDVNASTMIPIQPAVVTHLETYRQCYQT